MIHILTTCLFRLEDLEGLGNVGMNVTIKAQGLMAPPFRPSKVWALHCHWRRGVGKIGSSAPLSYWWCLLYDIALSHHARWPQLTPGAKVVFCLATQLKILVSIKDKLFPVSTLSLGDKLEINADRISSTKINRTHLSSSYSLSVSLILNPTPILGLRVIKCDVRW